MKNESFLRPYLGAYINLARNNLFTTLKFINTSVGASGGDDDNEAEIFKMSILSQSLSSEQELRARRLFLRHFPFLKYQSSDKEDLTIAFDDIRKCITACANVLSWWRNIYSHVRAVEDKGSRNYPRIRDNEDDVCQLLTTVPTVSARIIKERYSGKNEAQKGMLATDSLEFITKDRYERSRTPDGKRCMILNNQHFLYPKQDGEALPDGKNPARLSISGTIQFICLFLEKRYITEFLSQIHFLDDFSAKAEAPLLSQQRLLLETLSALRIRLPEGRIYSDTEEIQVALNILGELKKCPSEVFELLSAEDKSAFSVTSSDGESVLLRRRSDRFVPLCLSFFDTTKAFEKLRFQVNAGTFRYLFNDNKLCVDGERRIRVLQEPLNGFGRIQEVEKLRSGDSREVWKEFNILGFEDSPRNDASCLPYISDVYTRYLIDGDNIGMRLDGDFLPAITPDEDGHRYRVTRRLPDCTISRFDLPAMLFYHLIRPFPSPSAEALIVKAVSAFRSFFADIANGKLTPIPDAESEESFSMRIVETYGIAIKDIPDKIKDYLFRRTDDKKRFDKYRGLIINNMKKDTAFRLRQILDQQEVVQKDHNPRQRSDNKPGKRGYVQILPGKLASFLANDIVRLQEGKDKLTGLNYSIMQGEIATFSSHDPDSKTRLLQLFEKAGLVSESGENGSHPFLRSVMKNPSVINTVSLYVEYLNARNKYLAGPIPNSAPFLHSDKIRWSERDEEYYKNLAERLCKQPIMLTGSVFEQPIKTVLLGMKNPELTASITAGRCNIAYLIQLYQSNILDDGPQCFYGLCEGDMVHGFNYRLYSLVRQYRKEAETIVNGLSKETVYYKTLRQVIYWVDKHPQKDLIPKKRPVLPKPAFETIREKIRAAYKEMTETERLIRRLATQDTVLFMAASSSIRKALSLPEDDKSMKLYQIGRDGKSGILNKRIPRIEKQVSYGWKNSVTLVSENICIKDFGDIQKLISDSRVASLVHHLHLKTISTDELKQELDSYDNVRVDVFKNLFDYETNVLDSFPGKVPPSPDFNDVLSLDTIHTAKDKNTARIIRNGFCHNSYPKKEVSFYLSQDDVNSSSPKEPVRIVIYEDGIPQVADCMAKKIVKLLPEKSEKGPEE